MNLRIDSPVPDDRLLDRLVDDELDEPDRRKLLAGLDSQPDGWRRCALAFLEAQAWRRALNGLALDGPPRQAGRTSPPAAVAGRVASDTTFAVSDDAPSRPWCAMAACALVAFTLGVASQAALSGYRAGNQRPVVRADGGHRGSPAKDRTGLAGTKAAQAVSTEMPAEPDRVGGPEPKADVEFVASSPIEMIEAFRRRGHQVHRQRGVLPFWFEDGRQGFVPVEDLYVVPARLTTY